MSITLTDTALSVERHWQELAGRRRLYTLGGLAVMLAAVAGSLWFANESNAGKFWDRLPHVFDFIDQLIPRDGWEVWRALFDLPSPYDDGSLKYDYPEGRLYITETLYVPEYIYKMVETLNIALVSTIVGFALGFCLCFLAASNLVTQPWLRFFVRRFMEVLRLSISRTHEAKTLAIVLLLFLTIIAVDQISAWLRRKLVGEQAFAFGRGD